VSEGIVILPPVESAGLFHCGWEGNAGARTRPLPLIKLRDCDESVIILVGTD
jgi:hypothetical protein